MSMSLLSAAKDLTLGEGALYALIGFVIVLFVLALLVGIFYLSGYIFQSKVFDKKKEQKPAAAQPSVAEEDDDELVAVITAAVACMLQEEGGEPPEFVIKRIKRKK